MSISLHFKVSGSGGTTFALELQPTNTISEVKVIAKEKCSSEPETMKIIYKGRILKDADTLESLKVEAGSTMHVVKSVAPVEPTTSPVPIGTMTPELPIPGTQPPDIASDPMATDDPTMLRAAMQILGGANAGTAGTPDTTCIGGPGVDASTIMQMLNDPMIQQMMNNLNQNPQLLQQMIQNNPMLQSMCQGDPIFAQMMANPQVMQHMLNPETLQGIMQMQQAVSTAPLHGTTPETMPGVAPHAGMLDPVLMEAAVQAMMAGTGNSD